MKQDRLLIGILGVIGLTVISAVILFFIRREPQKYVSDETPEGVTRNYILALQKGDYQRAYGYLQETEERPDFSTFQQSIFRTEHERSRAAVHLGAVENTGDTARVELTVIHTSNDPFDRTWNENTIALLVLKNGEWKIASMPYLYWGFDWFIKR